MLKLIALCIAAGLALPVAAQDNHHLSQIDGLRVLHAWTPATTGPEALIYMEIENASPAPQTLTGGDGPDGLFAEIVGFTYVDGVEGWQKLAGISIASGEDLTLAPRTLALRLANLDSALNEGDEIPLTVHFGDLQLDVHVAVESKTASQHSHAGHHH